MPGLPDPQIRLVMRQNRFPPERCLHIDRCEPGIDGRAILEFQLKFAPGHRMFLFQRLYPDVWILEHTPVFTRLRDGFQAIDPLPLGNWPIVRNKNKIWMIEIDAKQMNADGHEFFKSENGVYLTEEVLPKYFL